MFLVKMSSAHSSSSSPHASDVPSSGKSKRKERGISKRPEGRFTITRVHVSGAPLSPCRAASAFRTTVGVVTRERVKITYDSWKEYTKVKNQKAVLLEEIFKSFQIPEQHKASVQRYALLAACKAWRNFKSTLIKDYVEKDFVEEYWEDFVAKKKTNDFRIESEAHRAF